jgi:hypothetical protein
MPFLIALIGLGLVGLLVAWGRRAARLRRAALAALAAEWGWRFDPDHDAAHDEEYAHFELFRRGHSRSAYNTLSGALTLDGRRWPAKAGDFRYMVTSSDGKHTTTHTYVFSYLIVHLPFRGVPDLLIPREGLFDKLAGVFGFDDIDFESEEFSRRYCVKSPDKRFAYAVVHPRMMEFLLAEQPPAIDIEQGRCCLTDGRSRWSPEEFRGRREVAVRFFEHWPEHLLVGLETA